MSSVARVKPDRKMPLPAPDFDSVRGRRFWLQGAARELCKAERVRDCCRKRIPGHDTVGVYRSDEGAHFGGLQVCGSVWMCPVCAAKVTERRRVELSSGVQSWLQGGGHVLLVTFTLQHSAGENLSDVLERLSAAYTDLRSRRSWKNFEAEYGVMGSVRALEVTHGANGWHPHLHVLMFTWSWGGDMGRIIGFENALRSMWQHVIKRAGGSAGWFVGVDVRWSDRDVTAYLAKWGTEPKWTAAHEVTKQPTKRGRAGGRSPLQLLEHYALGDARAGRLWLEYAVTMKGRRQLVWSRGLRDLLGLGREKTDEELAEEQTEDAIEVASFDAGQWVVILALDVRADILELAAAGDASALWCFLGGLGVPRCPEWAYG